MTSRWRRLDEVIRTVDVVCLHRSSDAGSDDDVIVISPEARERSIRID
jgi:hypothetical protein